MKLFYFATASLVFFIFDSSGFSSVKALIAILLAPLIEPKDELSMGVTVSYI